MGYLMVKFSYKNIMLSLVERQGLHSTASPLENVQLTFLSFHFSLHS